MGSTIYPVPSSAPIKSIQRGVAASATTVTISSVDITKSFVSTFSNSSSGDVSASGNFFSNSGSSYLWSGTVSTGTSFAAGNYGAYLSNSTSLVTSGPCYYEIVEYN